MIKLIEFTLLLGVFGVMIFFFIGFASDSIQTGASERQTELLANGYTNTSMLYKLYGLLATDGIIEVVLVAVVILVIVLGVLGWLKYGKKR